MSPQGTDSELSASESLAPETNAAAKLAASVGDEMIHTRQETSSDRPVRKRRVWLPLLLFFCTCLSTFWVGANQWFPTASFALLEDHSTELVSRQMVLNHWRDGLTYMVCVLGILLAHEFGHFFATMWYRIPASLPYVIPMPLLPIGTFGAVIGMDGRAADRKQTFDIGIAGPLAGLVVALPVMLIGIQRLDFSVPAYGQFALNSPLLVELVLSWFQPKGYTPGMSIATSQLNPYFMAGWVGLLITGLNMLPVSQLDGGHVIYTLFGRRSRWIARTFMAIAVGYVSYTLYTTQQPQWLLMIVLIMLIGVDHPPTRNDHVPLGWFRYGLGVLSLAIPLLCFAPNALSAVLK